MALGIDTKNLLEQWIPRLEYILSSATFAKNRYQVHRVFVCGTVLSQDEAAIRDVSIYTPSFSVTQEALDWQADQDVDLDEGDVYNHLIQMGDAPSTSMPPEKLYSCLSADRHVASAKSPTFTERAKGRPASAFHRTSFRLITLEVYNGDCMYPGYHVGATALDKLVDTTVKKVPDEWWESWLADESPELIWERQGDQSAVLWKVQVDVLDMWANRNPSPGRMRRRRYGTFLEVSPGGEEPSSSREDLVSEAKESCKRFKGVRYRADRRTFIAEMRVPKHKNKASFGDYKSSKEAARAIDAAFYHYGIRDKVNFADTPHILSTQSKPEGLNEADTFRFVKEQARWLSSLAPTLPSSPSSATPVASSTALARLSQAGNTVLVPCLGFNSSSSDIHSSSSSLECYGSVGDTSYVESQPQIPLPCRISSDATVDSSVSIGWLENTLELVTDVAAAHHSVGVVNESCEVGELEEKVVQVVWSEGNAFVDDPCVTASSECCPERWVNGSELFSSGGALKGFVDISSGSAEEGACDEFLSVSDLDLLCMSSPGFNLFQTVSWRGIEDDLADQLLQQQKVNFEDAADEQELTLF